MSNDNAFDNMIKINVLKEKKKKKTNNALQRKNC